MPVLPSIPEPTIKQFYLPSTADLPQEEQWWVKMDVSPMNVRDSLVVEVDDTSTKTALRVLAERIREWNGTEADGAPIPITIDSILRLGPDNLGYLVRQIPAAPGATLSDDQKKS